MVVNWERADRLTEEVASLARQLAAAVEASGMRGNALRTELARAIARELHLAEETAGGATKVYYPFNGQTVAVRDTGTNVVTYMHGDHLGSVSVASTSGGASAGCECASATK